MKNDMEAFEARIKAVEDAVAEITILSQWEVKVIRWTSRAVTGVGTIILSMMAFTGVLNAWQKITEFLK